MKSTLLSFIFASLFFLNAIAANINITISGFSYAPDNITVNVGDQVTIEASSFHPLIQVSQATWDVNGNTQLPGGFNSMSDFTFTITAGMSGTNIFYVCGNHASSGMKGKIVVNVIAGIRENSIRDFNFTVYPNPIMADAWINVSVKKAGRISLVLHDMQGRIIQYIIDMNVKAGEMTLPLDASRLQKGIYVLKMRTTQGMIMKEIIIQ